SLRHVRERCAGVALEAGAAVLQPAAHPVDDVLDDRLDRERQEACGASGDAAAARLVAREARLVDEQDTRAGGREPVRGGRARRPRADDRDVDVHTCSAYALCVAVLATNQPAPLREVVLGAPFLESLRREGAAWAEDEIVAFAASLADEPRDWGRLANEQPPVLRDDGSVEFHPAWDSLLQLGLRHGLQGSTWREPRAGAHVARAAKFVALAQVEAGVGCPLSMTHAAVPALRTTPELAREWEPRLVAGEALCGMSMTERQGGSDVRTNEMRAEPAGAREAALHGEKWFCSAPTSDAFLVLAQAPGGLSCYLVPRGDGFVVERLKDKLGNRSNASAEIRLDGARGFLVGEEGRGVATIIEMVVHTRLDCVLGSAALVREAVAQALHWCAGRVAFGKLLVEQPLMQNVLADL